MSRVKVVDLFAGAGGLGCGAVMAGADLRLSVENDPTCCRTLRANPELHPGKVVEGDVVELNGRKLREEARLKAKDLLLVIGGPPCQPFSKAAYWTDSGADSRYRAARSRGEVIEKPEAITVARPDDRRSLVDHFTRLVLEAKADAFLFENVPSILHPRNRMVLDKLTRTMNRKGFRTTLVEANAAEFGVPQARRRVFVLGTRTISPTAPLPTHWMDETRLGVLPPVGVEEAIAEFSEDRYREPEEAVEGRWARHLREIPPGWNYKHHTAWAGHKSPTFEAERRFWNFLLKLHPKRPSWTIAANPGPWTGPFHWDSRRLRTPELAAIQTFPPGYKFEGSRRERVRQIGNAVPPKLAAEMISALMRSLGCGRKKSAEAVA